MILVTGATGNVGRHVVSQLLPTGAAIRALTRRPETAGLPDGVEVVRGDLAEPDTLPSALAGVTDVFLFPVPGKGPAFVEAAKASGVRRVVLLSSSAVRDDLDRQPNPIAEFHADVERAIEESGLEWTFVRPGGFATNTLQWAPQIRDGGVVRGPYAAAAIPLIHEADIAAVAVKALTSDGHAGARYPLTGPEAVTQAEQVRIIGAAIGRETRYEEVPPEIAREQLARHVPLPIVDALLGFWARAVDRPSPVLPTVAEVTGRPARTFREWAADHAADFR